MRNFNYRLAKRHRNYSVEEVARLYQIHKNTVRAWIRAGLPTCDQKRPILILGSQLAAFLQTRRAQLKQPCCPGEIYCLRCRAPRIPAGNMADYVPLNERVGNLTAICPECEGIMNQRVSRAKLDIIRRRLDLMFPKDWN